MAQDKAGSGRRRAGQGSKWIRRSTRFSIYDRDGFCCVYCQRGSESGRGLSLDHVVPGGSNAPWNLVTACLSCNSARQDRSVPGFLRYLREHGWNTSGLALRIRRLTQRKLDRAAGRRLARLRNEEG